MHVPANQKASEPNDWEEVLIRNSTQNTTYDGVVLVNLN